MRARGSPPPVSSTSIGSAATRRARKSASSRGAAPASKARSSSGINSLPSALRPKSRALVSAAMRFLLIAVLLLVLAACQPLPHPFEDLAPPPNSPLMTPPDSAGVIVLPVAGAPGTTARDLADAMATALQDNDVPAGTGARNRGSYVLQGTATAHGMADGKMQVTVDWEMRGPDGKLTGQQQASTMMTASAWQDGGAG